ncbi:glycosyltransferase [Geodermatophilus sp. SYSU D00684]
MPEVSLVMPVWRPRAEWLREAVRAALDPDVDLELIVVDDGNPEPVRALLDDVDDPRLVHLRVPHGGVSHARNAGTERAAGRFLRYVDADDVTAEGSTQRLLALARDGAVSYEDTLVCDEELRPVKRISSRLRGDVTVPTVLGRFECRHVSMLFPAEVVRRAGPWDGRLRLLEDFDFVLRCVEQAPVVPGEGTATLYRRHDASATLGEGAVADAQRARQVVVDGFLARHPELRRTPVAREARRMVRAAGARAALQQDRPLAAVAHAVPLLPFAPRRAAGITLQAVRRAVRLSGAARTRTTARAPADPRRGAR